MNQGSKLKLISKGSNSEIYGYNGGCGSAVLKMVKTSCRKELHHLANEQRMLKMLHHENIIRMLKYKEGIQVQESSRNVLVLEKAEHGNLLEFYHKVRPCCKQSRWICGEVVSAVHYLHCNYFVHRDLKLENILVAQKDSKIKIKLADFGFANSTNHHTLAMSNSFKGTKKGYMAPQIHNLKFSPNEEYNTLSADIFALGVIIFTIVMGRFPFQYAKPDDPYYSYICNNDMEGFWNLHLNCLIKKQSEEGSMMDDFKGLFARMVCLQPSNRFTIQEVKEFEWMKGEKEQIYAQKPKGK